VVKIDPTLNTHRPVTGLATLYDGGREGYKKKEKTQKSKKEGKHSCVENLSLFMELRF